MRRVNVFLSRRSCKRAAVIFFKYFGAIAAVGAFGAAAFSSPWGGCLSVLSMFAWGMACSFAPLANRVKVLAKGTRPARGDLLAKMEKKQGKAFQRLPVVEQAMAARADLQIQRRLWWDAAAVMWMKENPGKEHLWGGLISSPMWFDDSLAWLRETCAKLEEAADRGWICPNAKMSDLLERPEMVDSKKELGDDIQGFVLLGDPWPSKTRYCDTLASMGHKLFSHGYSESLAWRSHGALERIKMAAYMDSFCDGSKSKGSRLRL